MSAEQEILALKSEIERLTTIVQNYKSKGILTPDEAYKLKSSVDTYRRDFSDLKRKFEKMEEWFGSYYSNWTKSIGNTIVGKPANDISGGENSMITIKVDKSITQKKKINPSELSYSELEACMNYFIENQHKLKNQPK